MIEPRFGLSAPWSLGLEEELMVVDARTLALVARGQTIVEETRDAHLPGDLKPELFASIVEAATGVCERVPEAVEHLRALRRAAVEVAGRHGLAVAAAGSHPFSAAEQQEIAPDERYRAFVRYAGVSARRQGVQGLHVHVGMPDGETCWRALEGVLQWLPVVLALSANSPYLDGRETGLASSRAEILALLPRSGAPPACRSYAEWEAWVARLAALRVLDDYTNAWWDVRPAPKFGTLEVRIPDQPTELAQSARLAALVHAMCVAAARGPAAPYDPPARDVYQQNRWAALRHGVDATLVHPDCDRVASVAELAAELVERVAPFAAELGVDRLVSEAAQLEPEGVRQLRVGRERGLRAVCADVVERTAATTL